jgi:hypothetical protein
MKWPALSDRVWQISIGVALVCLSPLAVTLWVIDPSSWPLVPDATHGIIVPFNNHGVTRYMSRPFSLWFDFTWWLFLVSFGWIVASGIWVNLRQKNSN